MRDLCIEKGFELRHTKTRLKTRLCHCNMGPARQPVFWYDNDKHLRRRIFAAHQSCVGKGFAQCILLEFLFINMHLKGSHLHVILLCVS